MNPVFTENSKTGQSLISGFILSLFWGMVCLYKMTEQSCIFTQNFKTVAVSLSELLGALFLLSLFYTTLFQISAHVYVRNKTVGLIIFFAVYLLSTAYWLETYVFYDMEYFTDSEIPHERYLINSYISKQGNIFLVLLPVSSVLATLLAGVVWKHHCFKNSKISGLLKILVIYIFSVITLITCRLFMFSFNMNALCVSTLALASFFLVIFAVLFHGIDQKCQKHTNKYLKISVMIAFTLLISFYTKQNESRSSQRILFCTQNIHNTLQKSAIFEKITPNYKSQSETR